MILQSALIQDYFKLQRLGDELLDVWGDLDSRFRLLRQIYDIATPRIIEAKGRFDPYFVDWSRVMTPIECNLWSDIRGSGSLFFFPQMPVGPYFVDFGDPVHKVALEADGRAFHDSRRDSKRDAVLMDEYGWTVLRFSGRETYQEGILIGLDRLVENNELAYCGDLAAYYENWKQTELPKINECREGYEG